MKVPAPRRPKIGPQIVAQFADGRWHPLADIISSVHGAVDDNHVLETLRGMRKNNTYGVRCEVKKVGTSTHWRLLPLDNPISRREAIEELRPIVEALKIEGKRNMATASPATVATLAGRLETLLTKWTQRPALTLRPKQRSRPKKGPEDSLHDHARGNDHHGGSAEDGGTAQLQAGDIVDGADDSGVGTAVRDDDPVADRKAAQPEPSPVPAG